MSDYAVNRELEQIRIPKARENTTRFKASIKNAQHEKMSSGGDYPQKFDWQERTADFAWKAGSGAGTLEWLLRPLYLFEDDENHPGRE